MLDHFLAVLLLVIVPIRALWRSRSGRMASGTKIGRYIATIGMVTGMLVLLATSWLMTGRSASDLGLGVPASALSLTGPGIAAAVLAILAWGVAERSSAAPTDAEPPPHDLMPETPLETQLFPFLCLAAGCGWEVLYRGFLLLYLQPITGLWGGVVITAMAYGAAHGVRTGKQFLASIVSAFAFTIGYAVTSSLWWLMLLHTGLMMLGAFASRASRRNGRHAQV